jgi:hypothetical protein
MRVEDFFCRKIFENRVKGEYLNPCKMKQQVGEENNKISNLKIRSFNGYYKGDQIKKNRMAT